MNPVAKRLAIDAADLRRRSAIHPAPHPGQRQKPSALIDDLGPSGKRPKLLSRIVLSQSRCCNAGSRPPPAQAHRGGKELPICLDTGQHYPSGIFAFGR